MKRYWDLSEAERSNLTSEQVESMLVVECMEKGVARVERPTLEPVPEIEVKRRRYYKVGYDGRYGSKDYYNALFDTAEQAQAFVELAPMVLCNDYTIEEEHKYAQVCVGLCVQAVDLCLQESVLTVKSQIEKRAAAKKRNEQLLKVYNDAAKKVDDAVSGVWDDWRVCREKREEAEAVMKTFEEYVGLCDGNRGQAWTFLGKAYDEYRIADAVQWYGGQEAFLPPSPLPME